MELITLYLLAALVVGLIAGSLGRSGFAWFLVAVLTSPVLGALFLLIAGRAGGGVRTRHLLQADGSVRTVDATRSCPHCHEATHPLASTCPHCRQGLTPLGVREISVTEAHGHDLARLARRLGGGTADPPR